ncbi:MAG TPA: hypothetical protein VHO25_22530 [Polyangiaceae bacterium]|nr:hypothetical protein [Polyangiaceae bacterium]
MKCTDFGLLRDDGKGTSHHLFLIEADSSSDLQAWPQLPSEHFISMIVWDAPSSREDVLAVARTILDAGAIHICAFGEGCERVHDTFDEVIATSDPESDDDHAILTTWHSSETLDEALWHALFTAFPAPAFAATTRTTVVIAVDAARYAGALRDTLADPRAFHDRVLEQA